MPIGATEDLKFRTRVERTAWWGRAVLWAHLAASPLVFSTGNTDPFEFAKATLLIVAVALAGIAALLYRVPGVLQRTWSTLVQQDKGLFAGAVLLVISAGLSAVFGRSPLIALRGADGSYAGLMTMAALLALLAATSRLIRTDDEERRLLYAIPWSMVAICTYALVQYAGVDPIRWTGAAAFDGRPRIFSTLGHPNHLAAWLSLGAPIVALLLHDALQGQRRARAACLAVVLALACVTVILSLSRGGWVAAAGGLGVFLLAQPGLGQKPRHRRRTLLLMAGLFVLLVAPAILLPDVRSAVAARVANVRNLGARSEMWAAALRVFRENPLLGCGPDNLALAFQDERTPEFRRIECDKTPTRAHNDLLQLLATQGALGFAALFLMIRGVVRRLQRESEGRIFGASARVAAYSGSLTALLIQGLAGFTVVPTAVLTLTVLALLVSPKVAPAPGGLATPPGSSPEPGQKRRRTLDLPLTTIVGLTIAGLAIFISIRVFLADRLWRHAELLQTGSPRAVKLLLQAERLDSFRDTLEVAVGESARQSALISADAGERVQLRTIAERAFRRATRLVPANGHNWLGLARLERDRWREGVAASKDVDRAFRAALIRDPRNAGFLADAANAALEVRDLESAAEFARRNVDANPDFGPPWGQLGLVELLRGRTEDARRLFEKSRGLDWCGQLAARVVMLYNAAGSAAASSDFAAAVQLAREALDLQPESVEARYNLARAFEGLGKLDDAKREYRTIIELHPVHPVARKARGRLDAIR